MTRLFPPLVFLAVLVIGAVAVGQESEAEVEPAPVEPMPLAAEQRGVPVRTLVRITTPPEIDGKLDEPVWDEAVVLDQFRQVEPIEDAEPSERTEVRLMYDEDFLYVAFRCFDRGPDEIIATQMKRDGSLDADDRVSFVIDPFFDRRNGFFFEMSPAGARGDALVEDNRRLRKDWDGIWYGRATIDAEGWVAEMAIPFKTISFDPSATRWGFNASRFIRRRNESIRWASPSQDTSLSSIADAGIIEGIHDIQQGLGIDIKPYTVVTAKRDHAGDRNGLDIDAGFDIFYKFTPSLTLALTVNTDFAETEVDERRVNLTRFPLFFPEKRDFFLQDAGIFNFGGINRNPLPFHSRRIGLGPSGQTIDILAGAKLTGRVEGLNVGLLDVQMKDTDGLGSKNLFVGRASLNVLDESTVGVILTQGDPRSDGDNTLGGFDFNYRDSSFNGGKTIEGHAWALMSETSGADDTDAAFGVKLGYPNDRIDWQFGFSEIGDSFNAALGFVPRRGIREYFGNWRYRWRPENDVIRRVDSRVRGQLVTNLDNEVESRELEFDLISIETEAGDEASVEYSFEREVLDRDFEISDGVIIPVDDYRFNRYSFQVESSRGRPVSFELRYSGGDFYTGTRDDYSAELEWRVSSHLFLGLEFEVNDVNLEEGDFITRLLRGRVNIFFTPDLAWTTFAQFDNQSESLGINSRVRWIIEPGNELFVVVNQAIDREDRSFRVRETELTTKLGWTFRF